ncbi:MAG: hypothetical protein DWQ05_09495 [Calditrichaeota bacterium]|nr:MAG: hypothetical protein DWQ05_09495 [Calditrichota bacterium]
MDLIVLYFKPSKMQNILLLDREMNNYYLQRNLIHTFTNIEKMNMIFSVSYNFYWSFIWYYNGSGKRLSEFG